LIWSSPLTEATLLKRYKRFLADVILDEKLITVHVPNTGSMTSCWEPNQKCALSLSPNPDRKMPYTLELTYNGETWIGVNTANANKLAKLWLQENKISELTNYKTIIPEKKIGESRVDFYLEGHESMPACFVEVKSVTLKKDGIAQFPDAVTERGQKHLRELMEIKKSGLRAVMLFIIQREDVDLFQAAKDIDPVYSQLLELAQRSGVEILAYQCKIDLKQIELLQPLKVLI
jgi:sugar fermentation stimulation protein A